MPLQTPLLLEGDAFDISHDGLSRTFYKLKDIQTADTVSIEEIYDLPNSIKRFRIRAPHTGLGCTTDKPQASLISKHACGVVSLGEVMGDDITLQEIDQLVFGSAGTGATTWESSIVMAMFFSSFPEPLRGMHVLELGSGVGLGGILLNWLTPTSTVTLTDVNPEVMKVCLSNMHASKLEGNMRLERIDWHGDHSQPCSREGKYDVIVASDCAYLYPDVVALARTIRAMLCPRNGKAHVFGPYNRGALHQLLLELRDTMDVTVSGIEIERYRLKTFSGDCEEDQDESQYASSNVAQFLHIVASHRTSCAGDPSWQDNTNHHHMAEID